MKVCYCVFQKNKINKIIIHDTRIGSFHTRWVYAEKVKSIETYIKSSKVKKYLKSVKIK